MKRTVVRAGLVLGGATAALIAVAAPAGAIEILPERDLYQFSEYYFGVNWTGWSIDAIANCRHDADNLTGGAYVARCTPTAYGARMDVYQITAN